jgi:hypothetical protein
MIRLLIFALIAAMLAGCGLRPVEGFMASRYAGTYAGTWTNASSGTSGAGRVVIALDTLRRNAALTLDFDGNYLGLNNPPPMTMLGMFDAYGAVVRGNDSLMGSYNVTIDREGRIVGLLKGMANGVIREMTYTGKLTGSKIETDYAVRLANGKQTKCTFRADKVQ